MRIADCIARIEAVAPRHGQAPWDNSGVQIAGSHETVEKLAVLLDPTPQGIAAALAWGAHCILCHHPLTLKPQGLDRLDDYHRVATLVLGAGAWLYAAHTSLDVRPEGPVGWLARELGLTDTRILEVTGSRRWQGVRFQAGPLRGEVLRLLEAETGLQRVTEPEHGEFFLICPTEEWPRLKGRLAALLPEAAFALLETAHPAAPWGFGLAGNLPTPLSYDAFCAALFQVVPRPYALTMGARPEEVRRVAYCTGSGSSLMDAAAQAGAQVFITGDMKFHQALTAPLHILDVGHFSLEEEMMRRFSQDLTRDPQFAAVTVRFFPGQDPFNLLLPPSVEAAG